MAKIEDVVLSTGSVVVSDYDPSNPEDLFYTSKGEPITEELAAEWQRGIEADDTLLERPSTTWYRGTQDEAEYAEWLYQNRDSLEVGEPVEVELAASPAQAD